MTRLMDRRGCGMHSTRAWACSCSCRWDCSFVKAVKVKMLPFDNKSEFQVILDLPEGTTLETTNAVGQEIAGYLRGVPEVKSTEVYAGTAAPFNFNGLVRHYFMRTGPNVADVQVNLVAKGDAVAPEPCHSRRRAARHRLHRGTVRGVGEGGGNSARTSRALDARRRGLCGR